MPPWVVGLVLSAVPGTGEGCTWGAWNYINNFGLEGLPSDILEKMRPRQIENVRAILLRHGRAILNEPFGAGKKLTALATAIVYRPEWPLLVICSNVSIGQWK